MYWFCVGGYCGKGPQSNENPYPPNLGGGDSPPKFWGWNLQKTLVLQWFLALAPYIWGVKSSPPEFGGYEFSGPEQWELWEGKSLKPYHFNRTLGAQKASSKYCQTSTAKQRELWEQNALKPYPYNRTLGSTEYPQYGWDLSRNWLSGRGWGQQLFSFQSLAVQWMARTSSLNCLSCRSPYQTADSLNCLPPFHWKPLFFTEKCFVASPSQKSALTKYSKSRIANR